MGTGMHKHRHERETPQATIDPDAAIGESSCIDDGNDGMGDMADEAMGDKMVVCAEDRWWSQYRDG